MKFALAGNPNCGKTTLFNTLTGSTAHVGNWPGVTVDKKEGTYKIVEGKGKEKSVKKVGIVDLPGIYSLSPYTPEEIVSRNYILDEADAIINIVDATNLERNLYLTTQLLETDLPLILALNMSDIVKKNGGSIDCARLEKVLGVPVVEISALKKQGIDELLKKSVELVESGKKREPLKLLNTDAFKRVFNDTLALFDKQEVSNKVFHAVKLLENDEIEIKNNSQLVAAVEAAKVNTPTNDFDNDYEAIIADIRYKFITANCSKAIKKKEKNSQQYTKSDKIDRVLTHRIWGIPIFLVIMLAVFHLTFSENLLGIGWFIPEGTFDNAIFGTDAINSIGVILFNLVDWGTSSLGAVIQNALVNAPAWVSSLICDGLLSGLFAVLSFIPQILLLFLFISILEDSGYMARVAFIMDRAFRRFGLSGKAFMPLLTCFGCAVPGIMATRTLENEKERRMAIMLSPFFSCGAKLPIWATFAAVMFGGSHGDLIVFSMYVLGIAVAIVAAIILKKTTLKGETPPFIMELPAYHLPQFKNTMIHLWDKLKHYIKKAATIIAGAVVVIWFLQTFNFTGMVDDPAQSFLGYIGKGLSYLFYPLGFAMGSEGWKLVVAAITGLIAKEMVVATMGTFVGMDDALEVGELAGTPIAILIGTISAPAAFAFMAFNLLSVPCMAAVATASGELGSKKKLWGAIGFWMLTAYVVAMVIYWVGTFWWIGLILAIIIAAWITLSILDKKGITHIGAFIKKHMPKRKVAVLETDSADVAELKQDVIDQTQVEASIAADVKEAEKPKKTKGSKKE